MSVFLCPSCGGNLKRVTGPGWMNDDQWDEVKAGDYVCEACPRSVGTTSGCRNNHFAYFDRKHLGITSIGDGS